MSKTVLGIDIGTSSVKVSVVRVGDGGQDGNCSNSGHPKILDFNREYQVLSSHKLSYQFSRNTRLPISHSQQSVPVIVDALQNCIEEIDVDLRKQVVAVGVCGQMHGVTLWSAGEAWQFDTARGRYNLNFSKVHDQITWQGWCMHLYN